MKLFSSSNLIKSLKHVKKLSCFNNVTSLQRRYSSKASDSLIFRQLFDRVSCTYTYILGDGNNKEAILIDPVFELAERDYTVVNQLGLKLRYVVNTHLHADHVTGSWKLKQLIPGCQSIISKESGAEADRHVSHGDDIKFGDNSLNVLGTPGHTNGCVTYYMPNNGMAFTGDTLLIRGCGRTDFQEGSASILYESVHREIFTLPKETKLFPAHDYNGQTMTTVYEEINYNKRLTKSKEDFIDLMNNLNLPTPKLINVAVPLNLLCGFGAESNIE